MGITPSYDERTEVSGTMPKSIPVRTAPSLTFAMQLDGDRCIGKKDGLEALEQAIYIMLRTERGEHLIYPWWYGIKTKDLYGKTASYIFAELSERIRSLLIKDDRINDVTDFEYSVNGDSMTMSYTVISKLGNLKVRGDIRV